MKSRRLLLWTGTFLVLLVAGTLIVCNRVGITRSIVIDALSDLIRGKFRVTDASLDPLEGTVRIHNFELSEGDQGSDQGRRVLKAPEVVVGVSMNPLGNPMEVQTVVVESPVLDLYLGDQRPIDLAALLKLGSGDPIDPEGEIPALELRSMTVRLHLPSVKERLLLLEGINLFVLPDENEKSRLVLEGRCKNPFGGTIRIQGTGDVENEEFRALVKSNEFELNAERLGAFGDDVAAFADQHEISGIVKPVLWLNYPDDDGNLEIGVRSEFKRLSVRPPAFTYKLEDLIGTASWKPDSGGQLKLLARREPSTEMEGVDAVIKLNHLESTVGLNIMAKVKGILVTSQLEDALAELPDVLRVYRAFAPQNGRADVDVFLHLPSPDEKPAAGGAPEDKKGGDGSRAGGGGKTGSNGSLPMAGGEDPPGVRVDMRLRGVDVNFVGLPPSADGDKLVCFPYPLTGAEGRIWIQDEFVKIEGVDARGSHGGSIHAEGELNLKEGEKRIDLRVDGSGLPLEEPLRDALAQSVTGGGEIFDEFAPQGRANLQFTLRQEPGEPSSRLETLIYPQGASVSWRHFPYRIDKLYGTIRILEDDVSFKLSGGRDPLTTLTARGRFHVPDDPDAGSTEMHVHAKKVPLDTDLRRALATLNPNFGLQWDRFAVSGTTEVDFLAWQAPGLSRMSFDLRADLDDCLARYADFPIDLARISGPVIMHSNGFQTLAEIVGVTAVGGGGRLLMSGKMLFGSPAGNNEDAVAVDLDIAGKGIRLDNQQLIDVLIEKDIMSRAVWDLSKASGTVDVVQRITRKASDETGVFEKELMLDLREVSSRAELLPDTLTSLSGRVRIDKQKQIILEDVTGRVGEADITCLAGKIWRANGDVFIELELSATDYPVDRRLANLLTGKIKEAYLSRNVHGQVSFDGFRILIKVPGQRPPGIDGLGLEASFGKTRFRAANLSFNAGVPITDLEGVATLTAGFFDPYRAAFDGTLSGISFLTLGQRFTDARGRFHATHEKFVLENEDLEVGLHGGMLRGIPAAERISGAGPPVLVYEFGPRGHLEANIDLSDVRLRSLLRDLVLSHRYYGLLGGKIRLVVDIVDPTTLSMQVNLGIRDANLGNVPVFRTLYGLVKPDKRPSFDSATLDIEGRDGILRVQRLLLKSPIIKIQGSGSISYDGYVNMTIDFPNFFPESRDWMIVPAVVRAITNATVKYDIYGYIGNTRTGPRVPLLQGKPRKQRMGPIPGRLAPLTPVFR